MTPRTKKLLIPLAIVIAGLLGLWIAGPLPPRSGAYLQSVTAGSAILAKVDRAPRRLSVDVWVDGDPDHPITATEDQPTAVHAIRVDGLRPGTLYRFRLRSSGSPIDGGSFRTAPTDDETPVRFAALGDTGELPWWYNMHRIGWSRVRPLLAWTVTPDQWRIADWIQRQEPHFLVHLGDIVYWRQLRDAHEEAFFRPFAALLRQTPLFTLAGNHDLRKDGAPPPFQEFFHNPSPAGVGQPQRNYTVAWGAVRLVALDVEDPTFESASTQAWFEGVLREATEPWLVVAIHRPCFSVYREESPALRDVLWPKLVENGVDLVISGDDHHYARFKPPASGAPIQLIAGGGGKSLYDFDAADPRLAASAKARGFVTVQVRGLRLEGKAFSVFAAPLDTFVIDRHAGPLPSGINPQRRARILRLRQGR